MAERDTDITPVRSEHRLDREGSERWDRGSFRPLQRVAEEFDRIFDEFGFGRRPSAWSLMKPGAMGTWNPQIEVFQKDDRLVVKADLPGIKKEDLTIDVTDEALTIRGERKAEHKEEREGYYRSERSYGTFHRVIPLPHGAITEQAKASFKDGVLEITMPAPPKSGGRRLEVTEGDRA